MTWLELLRRWLYIRRVNRTHYMCCSDCGLPLDLKEFEQWAESLDIPRCSDCEYLHELDMRERTKKYITIEGCRAKILHPGMVEVQTQYNQHLAATQGQLRGVALSQASIRQQELLGNYLGAGSSEYANQDNLLRALGVDPIQH